MIRQAVNRNLDQQPEVACPFSPVSCVAWFISPGLPDALPLLSALSVLAFHQPPAESVVTFSTADAVDAQPDRLRRDNELLLLEDTRAYLDCLARKVKPGPRPSGEWDRFFPVYTRRIHRAAQSYGLSASDAEDCVQDVWLEILDILRRAGHDPRWDEFSHWMHGVIRNQVVNFVRRMARRPDRGAQSLDDAVLGHDLDPVAMYERNQRRRLVRHVLHDLKREVSATNYRLVHFRWIEGLEVAEVAARLGLTSEQVRYRQHRVKKRLERLLELHGGGPE